MARLLPPIVRGLSPANGQPEIKIILWNASFFLAIFFCIFNGFWSLRVSAIFCSGWDFCFALCFPLDLWLSIHIWRILKIYTSSWWSGGIANDLSPLLILFLILRITFSDSSRNCLSLSSSFSLSVS